MMAALAQSRAPSMSQSVVVIMSRVVSPAIARCKFFLAADKIIW